MKVGPAQNAVQDAVVPEGLAANKVCFEEAEYELIEVIIRLLIILRADDRIAYMYLDSGRDWRANKIYQIEGT